jgi:hypothetical protein
MTAQAPPGFCKVGGHGYPHGIFSYDTNDFLLPEELDQLLQAAGCQPSQPVRIYACETGKGDDPFAQLFANYRHTDVQAPEEKGNMGNWGIFFIQDESPTPMLDFKTFHPPVDMLHSTFEY